ncbi:hypothetical protein [Tistlia consotensis]|nr:hypothetical protein [Tistlia consotensis]
MLSHSPAVRFPLAALPAVLLLALALAACGGPSAPPRPASAASGARVGPEGAPSEAEAPPQLQTRATISRELAEGGRSLRVTVDDLRPGERVALIALEGPDGSRVVAGPDQIRTGSRTSGTGTTRPRVQLEGGNNERMGVTLSMDVFSTRPKGEPERESALAWAFLPLPDPAAYAAAPGRWTVQATLQDETGRSLEIGD